MGFTAVALESPSHGAKDDRCKPGELIEVNLVGFSSRHSRESPVPKCNVDIFTSLCLFYFLEKNKLLLRGTVI